MSWKLAVTGCGRCLGQSWCQAPRTTDGVCAKPDACRHVAGLCSPALWPIGSARGLVRRPLRFRPSTCRRGRRDVRHSVGCTDPCLAGRDHGPGGQAALRRLGNLLGGVEANWPVASTVESVDIERRRVFEPVAVDAARAGKMVTASYGEHHATRAREFPFECRARDYPRVESVTAYTASRSPFQAPGSPRRAPRRRDQVGFRRTPESRTPWPELSTDCGCTTMPAGDSSLHAATGHEGNA